MISLQEIDFSNRNFWSGFIATSFPTALEEETDMYAESKGYYGTLSYLRDWFSSGCLAYYGADSCEFIGPENLYEKLGLLILYFDMEPLYMEQFEAESLDTVKYRGLIIGFQEVVNKIHLLNE